MVRDPLIGSTVAGRYRLISRLGQGGMSSVYLARHVLLDRLVAVKTLRRDLARDPTHRDRFLREARAANRINHPNIVEISDFGESPEGLIYLLMEYVPGISLLQALEESPFTTQRALRIAEQIASALGRAHEMGVIHRDLKPENIILVRRAEGEFAKVLDFGVAKILDAPSLTGSQQIFGTPGYIAPEYIRSSDIDGRADLYSLGVILYEMATGALPFDYEFPGDLLVKHVTEAPVPPEERFPGIDKALAGLILRCLLKDPADRHRDAFHFLEDLRKTRERAGGTESWGGMQEGPQQGAGFSDVTNRDPARQEVARKALLALSRAGTGHAERLDPTIDGPPSRPPEPGSVRPSAPAEPGGRSSVVMVSPIVVRDSQPEIAAPPESAEVRFVEESGEAEMERELELPASPDVTLDYDPHAPQPTSIDALSAAIQEAVRNRTSSPRHTLDGSREREVEISEVFSPRNMPTLVDERIRKELASLDPEEGRLDANVARCRGRFDAYRAALDSARRVEPEMEQAHLDAETSMAALEDLVDEIQKHEDTLEELHGAARELRATLGKAIDELAMQLSRERGELEKTVGRRDRLRSKHRRLQLGLKDGDVSEGSADAVLWELATLDEQARTQLARCDEKSGRLGALREQLDERHGTHEAKIDQQTEAMESAVVAADRLQVEIDAHLEEMKRYLIDQGLLSA